MTVHENVLHHSLIEPCGFCEALKEVYDAAHVTYELLTAYGGLIHHGSDLVAGPDHFMAHEYMDKQDENGQTRAYCRLKVALDHYRSPCPLESAVAQR